MTKFTDAEFKYICYFCPALIELMHLINYSIYMSVCFFIGIEPGEIKSSWFRLRLSSTSDVCLNKWVVFGFNIIKTNMFAYVLV